jgi:sulfatase maturation enzyme AslB (radical SAM superfamily)
MIHPRYQEDKTVSNFMKKTRISALPNLFNRQIGRLRCLLVNPSTFCLAVTYKCNGRCIMCNLWKTYSKNPDSTKEDLPLSEIRGLISDREFFKNLNFVYLSGGVNLFSEKIWSRSSEAFTNAAPLVRFTWLQMASLRITSSKQRKRYCLLPPDFK